MRDDFNTLVGLVGRKDYAALDELLTPTRAKLLDDDRRTLLMHAILADDADERMVAYLVDRGVPVHWVDGGQQWTALHFAARDNKEPLVRVLLERGAPVDAVDTFGNTPLWRCVMDSSTRVEVVELLVANGADPNKKNKHGSSPLDLAGTSGRDDLVAALNPKTTSMAVNGQTRLNHE